MVVAEILSRLKALLGPRQVGKTTLVQQVCARIVARNFIFPLVDPVILDSLEKLNLRLRALHHE